MGLLSGLFGGGNDTQQTETSPWEGLQPYLTGQDGQGNNTGSGLLPEAQRLYDQGGFNYYGGDTYAGFDPLQTQGQNNALNFAQGGMQQTADSALGANQLMTSGDLLYADSNPYLQQNITDANNLIGRDFRENVMPAIGNQAVSTGQYGSSRQGIAEGIAGRGVGEAIQRNTNSMMNNAYNTGLNMMSTGVGQSRDAMAGGLVPSQIQQDIGAQRQGQTQRGITDDVNRYNYNQQADWDNLARYQQTLGGNYMGSGGTSTVPVTGSNPLLGGLGGAATAAAVTSNPWGIAAGGAIGLLS